MRHIARVAAGLCLVAAAGPAEVRAGSDNMFGSMDVSLGIDATGPLLFRDTPDDRLTETTVYGYGPRLAFRFGEPDQDPHRFGLALGYQALARAEGRKLGAFDPSLLWATGGDTEIQFGAGYRVQLSDDSFKDAEGRAVYGGLLGGLELRHSFRPGADDVPLGMTVSVFGQGVLSLADSRYSTAFAGARVELAWFKTR